MTFRLSRNNKINKRFENICKIIVAKPILAKHGALENNLPFLKSLKVKVKDQ